MTVRVEKIRGKKRKAKTIWKKMAADRHREKFSVSNCFECLLPDLRLMIVLLTIMVMMISLTPSLFASRTRQLESYSTGAHNQFLISCNTETALREWFQWNREIVSSLVLWLRQRQRQVKQITERRKCMYEYVCRCDLKVYVYQFGCVCLFLKNEICIDRKVKIEGAR